MKGEFAVEQIGYAQTRDIPYGKSHIGIHDERQHRGNPYAVDGVDNPNAHK